MKVYSFVLCEYATLSIDKKPIIMGIFEAIRAEHKGKIPRGPIVLSMPKAFLVAITDFSLGDGLRHTAKLQVFNDDEKLVSEHSTIQLNLKLNQQGRPMRNTTILEITGMPLPGPGDYRLVWLIDDTQAADYHFYLTLTEKE